MPKLTFPDSPNTLNGGFPRQATQAEGRGFFTSPNRGAGTLRRQRPSTFGDHWTQPRLFYNSLTSVEQQFLIDAIRLETSQLQPAIQENVLVQLNRISHDIAVRVGEAIGLQAPEADPTYYHDNTTADISIFGERLPTIATLQVGVLASTRSEESLAQARAIQEELASVNVTVTIVGETLANSVGVTYSAAQATAFDGIILTEFASVSPSSRALGTLVIP